MSSYETALRLKVRLTRKLADSLNGIDLAAVNEGDCVELLPSDARVLILEGWAQLIDPAPVETPIETPVSTRVEEASEAGPEPY